MADPNNNTKDKVDTEAAASGEHAHEEIADEALVEEVSIDGMCGVY